MSVSAHIHALHQKHETLEQEIAQAYAHHSSDVELNALKRVKLKLKDQMELLKKQVSNENSNENSSGG